MRYIIAAIILLGGFTFLWGLILLLKMLEATAAIFGAFNGPL